MKRILQSSQQAKCIIQNLKQTEIMLRLQTGDAQIGPACFIKTPDNCSENPNSTQSSKGSEDSIAIISLDTFTFVDQN